MGYRCLSCGALYEQSGLSWCSSCWTTGCIVPQPHRHRAEVDYQPGVTNAKSFTRMSWGEVQHEVYSELKLGPSCLQLNSGGPGAGKSTSAARELDSLHGPVLYVSAEQGLSPSLSSLFLRARVKRDDFFVMSHATVDQIVQFVADHKCIGLCIDSVQVIAFSARELRHILEVLPGLELLIAVMQITKGGLPAGAMNLQHEADVHLSFEKMKWTLIKSRYQAETNPDGSAIVGDVMAPVVPDESPSVSTAKDLVDTELSATLKASLDRQYASERKDS